MAHAGASPPLPGDTARSAKTWAIWPIVMLWTIGLACAGFTTSAPAIHCQAQIFARSATGGRDCNTAHL
jgi:hypothetical protein